MYSSNAHRGKPGGSVCTTYNVRQHCHSKQLTVTVQCLWHRHVAVHSIRYKRQCPWHKHVAVHSIQYKRQCPWHKHAAVHSIQYKQQCPWHKHAAVPMAQTCGSAHGTNMWQYTAYNISGSAHVTNMQQCPWHKHVAVHSIQYKQQC